MGKWDLVGWCGSCKGFVVCFIGMDFFGFSCIIILVLFLTVLLLNDGAKI